MSERIIVDLDRAGKLESEIEKKLQSGQSIGSIMDESLAVVKNEISQTEELGGSATIDVDSIVDGSTSSYTGATTTNKKVIAKQNTEEVVLDDILFVLCSIRVNYSNMFHTKISNTTMVINHNCSLGSTPYLRNIVGSEVSRKIFYKYFKCNPCYPTCFSTSM